MTTATFFSRNGRWYGFRISGHSGDAPAGESIVCAAVSSAAYMAANTVTDVCGCEASAEVRDGFLSLSVSEADLPRCQITLEGFHLHMKMLQEQYPDNIQLDYTEV